MNESLVSEEARVSPKNQRTAAPAKRGRKPGQKNGMSKNSKALKAVENKVQGQIYKIAESMSLGSKTESCIDESSEAENASLDRSKTGSPEENKSVYSPNLSSELVEINK